MQKIMSNVEVTNQYEFYSMDEMKIQMVSIGVLWNAQTIPKIAIQTEQ